MNLRLKYTKNFLPVLILSVFTLAIIIEKVSATVNVSNISQQDTERTENANSRESDKGDKDRERRKREKEEKKRAEKAAKTQAKSESHSSKSELRRSAQVMERSKPEAKKAGLKQLAGPSATASTEAMEIINATVETDPVPNGGDAADDPAIWINLADPAKSTIIGTDKRGGLAVYELNGKQIQYLPDGLMDNVDIRDGFMLNGQKTAIVAASNRRDNSMAIYKVNPQTRMLEPAAARTIKHGMAIYGMCLYHSAKSGKTYYFGTSKSGDVEQWELFDNGNNKVDAKSVRKFKVGSVVEGCVADDDYGHFYISEETVGIWKYGAEPDAGSTRVQVDKAGGGHLVPDIEGLTIAYGTEGKGYLIVSSQGNSSFVVYRREGNNEFVKKFRIGSGSSVDGAEETDGIDVTTANLGPAFPNGVFVVQDGFNDKGNQNFKLVPFQAIIKP